MPIYCYKCKNCGKEFENINRVEDRYKQKCVECGSEVDILVQPTAFHIFKPFMHPNLTSKPVLVKSRKHLKELDRKYNMTSFY